MSVFLTIINFTWYLLYAFVYKAEHSIVVWWMCCLRIKPQSEYVKRRSKNANAHTKSVQSRMSEPNKSCVDSSSKMSYRQSQADFMNFNQQLMIKQLKISQHNSTFLKSDISPNVSNFNTEISGF